MNHDPNSITDTCGMTCNCGHGFAPERLSNIGDAMVRLAVILLGWATWLEKRASRHDTL